GALYAFHVRDLRAANSDAPSVPTLLRLPVLLSEPVPELVAVDADGARSPASLVNLEVLGGGKVAAEFWVPWVFAAGEVLELALVPGPASSDREPKLDDRLANAWIEVELDEETGIESIRAGDWEFGGKDFLDPFVSYRTDRDPVTYSVSGFERIPLRAERLENLERVRMRGRIPFETPDGSVVALLDIDLTLPADAPWMIADVTVSYPYTTKRDVLNNIQQKLRRYLDLRWIEVAPFPLRPRLEATREQPIRIWKHNWLGVTSSFDLDYAAVNPKNAELDAFNHQVTAGWVAMSDGTHGLLVAQGAELRSVYAFAPMRLREHDGKQVLQVNPFGSYFGRQLDYTHMDGTGLGTDFTKLISASLRPNGPSYNGERERFSLMIAPYAGDAPPATLQAAADAFFHPPAVVVMEAPFDALLPVDIEREIDALRLARARRTTGPLPIPQAFLANPTHESVDLVWDVSRDPRIDGYDVEWRRDLDVDWQQARLGPVMRYRVGGLSDGERYAFRVRARSPGAAGVWTETSVVAVGPVEIVSAASAIEGAPILLLLRTFYYGLVHLFTTP
ncbi:MAG: fibronectin type III domain-containing protein, partial [Myxococcales bacterium]|nr:fibronectin type III domain-containing protein [Myxococcales bacterium]